MPVVLHGQRRAEQPARYATPEADDGDEEAADGEEEEDQGRARRVY